MYSVILCFRQQETVKGSSSNPQSGIPIRQDSLLLGHNILTNILHLTAEKKRTMPAVQRKPELTLGKELARNHTVRSIFLKYFG